MNKTYSEELKKQALFNVLCGQMRKSEGIWEYGMVAAPSLDRWIERYGRGILIEHKELLEQMGTRKKKKAAKGKMPETEELRGEVDRLKKDLRAAGLRAEAYSLMIEIAFRRTAEKVAIRKKSVTAPPPERYGASQTSDPRNEETVYGNGPTGTVSITWSEQAAHHKSSARTAYGDGPRGLMPLVKEIRRSQRQVVGRKLY